MLPPFVPPSARASAQPLPLITEFVVDRVERSFEPHVPRPAWEVAEPDTGGLTATLPSIDEFLLQHAESAIGTDISEEAVSTAAPPVEDVTATVERSTDVSQPVAPEGETAPEDDMAAAEESVGVEQADQSLVGGVEEVSAPEPVTQEPLSKEPERQDPDVDRAEHLEEVFPVAEPVMAGETWVAEERDAFDWQGAATLAPAEDEERRAAADWSSTDWDHKGTSTQDYIVSLLAQVARRVRSGELHVHGNRAMTAEAALAAVLAALLSAPNGDQNVEHGDK